MSSSVASLPPPSIDWSADDLDTAWRKFYRSCKLHFDGPLHDVDEAKKITYLLLWAGTEGQDIADTFSIPEDQQNRLQPLVDEFQRYVRPRSNFRVARFRLLGSSQRPDESADAFVKRLKTVIADCDYSETEQSSIIVDVFIIGLRLKSVQSSLLKEGKNLSIGEALRVARTEEAALAQVAIIRGSREENLQERINTVHQVRQARHPPRKAFTPQRECRNCGRQHELGKCPAKGQSCNACGKSGHWRAVCRSIGASRKQHPNQSVRKVHELEENEATNEPGELLFNDLLVGTERSSVPRDATQAFVTVVISSPHRDTLRCKVDTGAEGNVMPLTVYNRLRRSGHSTPDLSPSPTRIVAFGGATITHHGTCTLQISHGKKKTAARFYVTDTAGPVLLGLPTCRDLEIVSLNFTVDVKESIPIPSAPSVTNRPQGDAQAREKILQEFADIFKGIGCFEGTWKITVDPSVPPVVHPPRRIPVSLKDKLKNELDSLVSQGIISPVTYPTDWVNSFVCVTKSNGNIRLCLDPRDLNRAVKRPHYVTPTLEDVLCRLHGAKYFSILDARSGYWNLKLDEESADLTTFNTVHGRFRFNRLPFGISCAQDEFQRAIDNTFGDIPNVLGIADDIVVVGYAEDGSDHDATLRAVLERARQRGPRFNDEKLIVRAREIPFFGHLVGSNGVKPDPSKVKAIIDMEPPTEVKQLQSFLGMVNYLNRFSPRLASLTAPLRALLKRDSHYAWSPSHEKSFHEIKSEIEKTTALRYYDPSKPLFVQVDASGSGLGAALIQEHGPIAFASKSLCGAETRYSNIEREMLGIIFGLERFHHYVYGRHVIVHSDHKPLEAISMKNLANAPPRLARMLLRAQRYDFTVVYRPGQQVTVADALSRISPSPGTEIEDIDVSVHDVDMNLHATPSCLSDARRETAADPTLSAVVEAVIHGWPLKRSECPAVLTPFWNYREELGVHDGLLLKGIRIVVPNSMKPRILAQLHAAHQGIEKTKLLARSSIFWVGMSKEIEDMVKKCDTCQRHQPAQQREPLLPHEVAPRPWHTIAADLFHWEDKTFLLVGDTLSRFPIVRKLTTLSSNAVIIHLRGIFDEYGLPERLISDNGPQFAAKEFGDFANSYGFEHVTSSPHYPQSNGFIERLVGTVKKIFTKCRETGLDPHLALLNYRATPLGPNLPSPAELLLGRKVKTLLLSRPPPTSSDTREALTKIKEDMARRYNTKARELPPLHSGQAVRARNHVTGTWEPAEVTGATSHPRSYIIETDDGRYRRNRRDLRPSTPTASSKTETSQESTSAPANQPTSDPPLRRSARLSKPPDRFGFPSLTHD